jgi:hypothetical protein
MVDVRQSRPDSGLGFQTQALKDLLGCPLLAQKRHKTMREEGPLLSEEGTT